MPTLNVYSIIICLLINLITFRLVAAFGDYECRKKIKNETLPLSLNTMTPATNRTTRETSDSEDAGFTSHNIYLCPGRDYPEDHIMCCDFNRCCTPKENYIFFQISENDLPFFIVIALLSACCCFVLTLAICCFWSACPLYNSCRIRYYHDETSCADKFGENSHINLSTMPDHEPIGNCVVIVKHFDSDSIEDKHVVNVASGDQPNGSVWNSKKSYRVSV